VLRKKVRYLETVWVKKEEITHLIGIACRQQLAAVWSCLVQNTAMLEMDRNGGLVDTKKEKIFPV